MTREEAIKALERAEGYIGIHYVNGVEDPYINPCLLKAIDFAVAALREQEKLRWIPVTERLPEVGKNVLVYSEMYGVCVDCYDLGTFGCCYVTHWMPLPEPPKEDVT